VLVVCSARVHFPVSHAGVRQSSLWSRLFAAPVTLVFRGKVAHRGLPRTFANPDEFVSFALSHDVYRVNKDGVRLGYVSSLDEARAVVAPDFLQVQGLSDAVANLELYKENAAHGLEQQTTRAIAINPTFLEEFGSALRLVAGGEPVVFRALGSPTPLLEVDGLVAAGTADVFMNECKSTPGRNHIASICTNLKGTLERVLANTKAYVAAPPCLDDLLKSSVATTSTPSLRKPQRRGTDSDDGRSRLPL
jgi:hypothetical protein